MFLVFIIDIRLAECPPSWNGNGEWDKKDETDKNNNNNKGNNSSHYDYVDHPLFVLQIVQIDLFKVLLGMPLVYLL